MKATETKFLPFLQGTKQFLIPIYQRTYSWTASQCQQLLEDIVRVGSSEDISGHFVGSIVYVESGLYQVTAVPQLLIIDGQQRVATLSILLAALGRVMEESHSSTEITQRKINNYYLINNDEEGSLRYKLLLTRSDKETLISIIEELDDPPSPSTRLLENYKYFLDYFRKHVDELNNFYRGVGKLIIVDISLDRERDNPQLIFESLNSTGLKLSQADLIRNYILMGLDSNQQNELYNHYWYPMEQSFGNKEYADLFDRFIRDYLTIKTGRIPNVRDVYTVFKVYKQEAGALTDNDLVADIYEYSKHFVRLAFERDQDNEINQVLQDINTLRIDVAYPFLMALYADYDRHIIDRATFLAVLKLVESYVFRRIICGIPTNSVNKTFATLGKEIDKERYLDSVKAAFLTKDSYRRFPNDEEFARELEVKDVYSLRNRNYFLRKLENHGRKEIANVESYTIEHILPQNSNLSSQWISDLGPDWKEIQAKYLHTIGNLTLTGYNSELSDRPFLAKRDMEGGFAGSPLRMNRGLADVDRWSEEAILARTRHLANEAVEIWRFPDLPEQVLQQLLVKKARPTEPSYKLEIHSMQGFVLGLFEELRKRILNLDSSVREEVLKLYIAYKAETNFVDVIPQKSRLVLTLNMKFDELEDPEGVCRDITHLGKWGNGDIETYVASYGDIDKVMPFIRQSLEIQQRELGL